PVVETSDTIEVGEETQAVETSDIINKGNASASVDKGKALTSVEDEPVPQKKRGRLPSQVDGIRIYHKNNERSKRIANMKSKFQFDNMELKAVDTTVTTADIEKAPVVETGDTIEVGEETQAVETSDIINKGNASTSVDKGKALTSVEDEPVPQKKRGRLPSHVDGIRIYHKNNERSKRIANMKSKFQFDNMELK
nr:hypothetical protein [Tanacetum cinerariifolium]